MALVTRLKTLRAHLSDIRQKGDVIDLDGEYRFQVEAYVEVLELTIIRSIF
jgi:hypothetical protein